MHTQTNQQPAFNNQSPFTECNKKNKQLEQEKQDLQAHLSNSEEKVAALQAQLSNSEEKVAALQAQIDAINAPTPPAEEANAAVSGADGLA